MEKVDQYKQPLLKFILNELVVFISQVTVFFMVAVFTSNFLSSEEKLVEFSNQKMNDSTLSELGLTFLAIFMVTGIFSAIGRIFENKYVEHYITEALCEMPKTIYFFGSSATGVMAAISLFVYLHPTAETSPKGFTILTVLFAFMVFIYGCSFSYAFKRKTHIIAKLDKPKLQQENSGEANTP